MNIVCILEDLSYLSNTKPLSSSHSNNLCILVPWMRGFFATPCAVRTVGVAGKPPEAASTRMITINCVLVEVVEWLECQLDDISRSQIYVHSGRILSTTSIASTDCQACSIYRLFSKLLALKMFLRFSSFPLSISRYQQCLVRICDLEVGSMAKRHSQSIFWSFSTFFDGLQRKL